MPKTAWLLPVLFLLSSGCQHLCTPPATTNTAPEKQAIADYIKANPELILEVLRQNKKELLDIVMQANQQEQKARQRQNVMAYLNSPLMPDMDPVRPCLGDDKAEITVVGFSNFLCPACAQGANTVSYLQKKHPGEIKFCLRHLTADEFAKDLALHFEAIARQSPQKAWTFYKKAMADQENLKKDKMAWVNRMINELAINRSSLARDLADPALAQRLKRDSEEAALFQLQSSPSYVINGVAVDGAAPASVFEEIIGLWREHQAKSKTK
jgi:protein-disulfide isomerase